MKKWKKISLITLSILILGMILMIIFSPYKHYGKNNYRSVDYTITINVPADSVFRYLGNSGNAEDWSSFVDHITALNEDKYPDGTVGSIRRCFQNKDEKGIIWDEEILEVIPNKLRRLSIYNLQGFSLQADGLQTEQIYKELGPGKMELTFSVFFRDHEPSWIESLKMYYASYTMKSIFAANLKNVKRLTEK